MIMDNTKTVQVVPVTPEDFDNIIAMAQAMQAESPRFSGAGTFDTAKVLQLCHNVHAKARAGDACMLLATTDGQPVGFLVCITAVHFFSDERYTVDLAVYVKPEHRRAGVLAHLVQPFEAWAAAQGVTDLTMGISTETNAAGAVAAYERLGYQLSGYLLVKSLESSDV